MSATSLSERAVAQTALGRAVGVLSSARTFFYATATETWDRTLAGCASTGEQKATLMLAAVHLMQSCVEAVDEVCRVAGTSGIYTRSPLERAFRDVHTARHHGWVSDARYATYGSDSQAHAPNAEARKSYRSMGSADAQKVKRTGAFRAFSSYRLFAIIGALVLFGGYGISALSGGTISAHGGGGGHDRSVRREDVQRTTAEPADDQAAPARTVKQYLAAPPASIDPSRRYTAATGEMQAGEKR